MWRRLLGVHLRKQRSYRLPRPLARPEIRDKRDEIASVWSKSPLRQPLCFGQTIIQQPRHVGEEQPPFIAFIPCCAASSYAAVAELANEREYKRERDGKFAEVDHPRDHRPGINPDSAATQAAEIGKGKAAIDKCLGEKCDVPNAVSRGDVGLISLVYTTGGDDPRGMVRFLERPDARKHLAETLVRGKAVGPYQQGQKLNLVNGGYVATLRLTGDAKAGLPRNWVLTGFGPEDKKDGGSR